MDDKRVFLVAVDVLDPVVDPLKVKEFFKTSPEIKGWWNHIPGCFLVSTELNADRLTDEIRKVTGNARLLVIAVRPSESEGWLPESSWTWIRRRETEDVE